MKKIVYICDNCGKDLKNKKHISINFSDRFHSGWVEEIDNLPFYPDGNKWKFTSTIKGIVQFCSIKCLSEKFEKMFKDSEKNGK